MRPDRAAIVDGAFLFTLGAVATAGFRDTFDGVSYVVAALAGLALGGGLGYLAHVLARPVVLVAVFTIAAFFLLGGAVALHADGPGSMLPMPHTLHRLADASVHGWKALLTTLAPVDNGPLLTLPYLMALCTGAAGMTLAVRTRSIAWPLAAPAAYLAAVILLGIRTPTGVTTVGMLFAIVATAWMGVRSQRLRGRILGGRAWSQRAVAAVLVVGAGVLAVGIGPQLPGAGHERVVLRSYVSPPFNVGEYPSPLAGFRRYTKGFQAKSPEQHLYEQTILTVKGLPAGTLLRFAALDRYDGHVWAAADQAPGTTGAAGAYQRVGSVIRQQASGRMYTAHVTIAKPYAGQVWLPTAGALTRLSFTGTSAADQSGQFRYNLATGTGIVPPGLRAGDSYTFTATVDDTSASTSMSPARSGTSVDSSGVDFTPVAARWAGGEASTPMAGVLAIAAYLKSQGRYTDGGPGEEQYAAGHSVARLSRFSADGQQAAGDDEQYAAMMALLANGLGVPARAVVGAVVPPNGEVKGSDVHAWVELRDESGAWLPLPTDDFMNRDHPPDNAPPQPQQLVSGQEVPPPAPVRPPSSSGDPLDSALNHRIKQSHHGDGFTLPAWLLTAIRYAGPPVVVVALAVGLILGSKAWRRRRRRTRGAPARRLAAAWRELVDHARDFGHVVVAPSTRREQARLIAVEGYGSLAREADRHVFGAVEPTDADAASYWDSVDRLRAELAGGTSRRRRIKAALSLRSFRAPSKGNPA